MSFKDYTLCIACGGKNGKHKVACESDAAKPAQSFDQYANVFNTKAAALNFVKHHRPGYVVVKVGRKYVPATDEFAKRMGLKPVK